MYADNPDYRRYEEHLTRLAILMSRREGASEEAHSLREYIGSLEDLLQPAEIERLRELSSDLYMIEEDEIFDDPTLESGTPDRLVDAIKTAFDSRDWLRVLVLLRQESPLVSNELRAYLRARAYEGLQQIRSASVFLHYASSLAPDDVAYRYLRLELQRQIDMEAAAVEADIYLDDPHAPKALRFLAASIVFMSSRTQTSRIRSEVYIRLVPLLERDLEQVDVADELPREVIALAYVTLGFCLDGLGAQEAAAAAFGYAVRIDPDNDAGRAAIENHKELRNAAQQRRTRPPSAQPQQTTLQPNRVPAQAASLTPASTNFSSAKISELWQSLALAA